METVQNYPRHQTITGNEAQNESEGYVLGDSDKKIAMFPEEKDFRNEIKNSFKGQWVNRENQV
jgi:hypothetical protein